MLEYQLSLTSILLYKDIISDSALIREYRDQRKIVLYHVFLSENYNLLTLS